MKLTNKQKSALGLFIDYKFCLLYGGARSGKTFITIYYIIARALKYAGSRHLICRRYSVDVHAAVWDITTPDVLRLLGLQRGAHFSTNEQKMELTFNNGSTIICSGTDDKSRLDQILGREYATIYANEANDISYLIFMMLRTRLSQLVDGCTDRFIVDLNPAGDGHWTYKLFFRGLEAQSLKPLTNAEQYGKLQLNPFDNRDNLADHYIEDMLEPLTGDARARFLEGNYQSNNELLVFRSSDSNYFEQCDFSKWADGRLSAVRIVGGLDVGFQDADAFALVAYIDGDPIGWVLYEYKAFREELNDLAEGIKRGLHYVQVEYPWYQNAQLIPIYSDTNTVRYGKEGDKKKNWPELKSIYGFNCMPAFKRDKSMHVEFLRSLFNGGQLRIPRGGIFCDEITQIVWHKNPIDETIEHIIDDDVYHPDFMFALMYAVNYILTYGNKAWKLQIQPQLEKDNPENQAITAYEDTVRNLEKNQQIVDDVMQRLSGDSPFF